jgi:polyisoprenoid-binding protein YceI
MVPSKYFLQIFKSKIVSYITISLFVISAPYLLTAQPHTLNSQSSKLIVEGTSSLHDWEIESSEMTGIATITTNSSQELTIADLTFTICGETLKSGKGAMDKNTYDALNTKEFPKITYKLKSVISTKKVDQNFQISTEGELTIAGKTLPVMLDIIAKTMPNGSITISGNKAITMSTFSIDPPTALFGTIKTGDDITIKFNVNYTK